LANRCGPSENVDAPDEAIAQLSIRRTDYAALDNPWNTAARDASVRFAPITSDGAMSVPVLVFGNAGLLALS
jgi:hypothetical protein